MVYAHICRACDHPISRHRLTKAGVIRLGPYRCQVCDCEIPQNAPSYPLSESDYRARFDQYGKPYPSRFRPALTESSVNTTETGDRA